MLEEGSVVSGSPPLADGSAVVDELDSEGGSIDLVVVSLSPVGSRVVDEDMISVADVVVDC